MNKVTALYQVGTSDSKLGGWSESWYLDGAFGAADAAHLATIRLRLAMLPVLAVCVGTRVQVLGGAAYNSVQNIPGSFPSARDIPQMALNVRAFTHESTGAKTFQLRGLADSLVVNSVFSPVGTQFLPAFSAYANSCFNQGLRFRQIDKTSPPVNIVSIAADGTFVLAGPMVYAVGDQVQILRARTTTGLKVAGAFYVSVRTDANNGKFANWGGGLVQGNGKARKLNIVYPLIGPAGVWQIRGATTRKVGRPFALYHGRRSKR